MRWRGRRESTNIEDRRGQSGGGFGGGGMLPFKGKSGILMFVVVLIAGYYGVDLSPLLSGASNPSSSSSAPYQPSSAEEAEAAQFTSVILASTEDSWNEVFKKLNRTYQPPKLVMYTQNTRTSCGVGQAMMGPFYCPADQTVYIDLAFYQEMKNKLGGGGEFAQGYVVAHEVGHHVQNLLGTADKVRAAQQRMSEKDANKLSVALELQADCYAGIWGQSMNMQNVLENGDLEQALNTAQAIGDDQLQKQATGTVVPDSFTHGTSEQRYQWFKRGYETADINQCNTFDQS